MSAYKTANLKPILSNAEASLFDIGDGITYLELHGKLNIIQDDTLDILDTALDEVETNYAGMILSTEADHFSVGLNLILLLERARSNDWEAISQTLKNLQRVCNRLRYSKVSVVAATVGMALGGGCELAFGADVVQADTNSKLGLVELRVGLIPGGGGTTEMAYRCLVGNHTNASLQQQLSSVWLGFDTIRQAKVSANYEDAQKLGFLRETDQITSQRSNLIPDAKQFVKTLCESGYQSPESRNIYVLGEKGINHINQNIQQLRQDGTINDYEQTLAQKLAYVFCGGMLSEPQFVNEQHLLDLEHEIFLSLCGEPDTHAMIESTLNRSKK